MLLMEIMCRQRSCPGFLTPLEANNLFSLLATQSSMPQVCHQNMSQPHGQQAPRQDTPQQEHQGWDTEVSQLLGGIFSKATHFQEQQADVSGMLLVVFEFKLCSKSRSISSSIRSSFLIGSPCSSLLQEIQLGLPSHLSYPKVHVPLTQGQRDLMSGTPVLHG